ncbi:hypothetical protein MOQ_006821 [Trypanosoma cruzi marinkellei]|uniref:Uncharacterized protein n=1 Tax=Trypanosoma cruzi marinkellei TaxID=85056 RepID=K2NKE7_TRYCR|nr:hypothetical protein MOQ_006821 [Trypanosoma cruzi marinkellei]
MPHRECCWANPAALCTAMGERRTGPPPPVSTAGAPPTPASIHSTNTASDVVKPAGDETARGLSERIALKRERRRGGVPRCTVAAAAPLPSRSASRWRPTPLTMGDCWPCSAVSRAWAVAPNACCAQRLLRNHLRGGRVGVSAREKYSRQQLASAGAAQCSVLGPQLLRRHVDGLPRRLDSINLRRRPCTLTKTRLLCWVRASVLVLRQCRLPCLLWPHGLLSKA